MDEAFDCRGVVAPTDSSPSFVREMEAALLNLAEMLRSHGLMDLEVIQAPEGTRVLEIDTHFPSQTPTTVWLSTGVNLAEHLVACFFPYAPGSGLGAPRFARYEHVLCKDGGLHFLGEHIMGQFGPLEPTSGFCGADGALVGGSPLSGSWVTTPMFAGQDTEDMASHRSDCIEHLRELAERQTGKTIFKGQLRDWRAAPEYITMLAGCNGWLTHAIMSFASNPVPFIMQRAVALLPVVRHGFPCIFSAPEKTFAEIPLPAYSFLHLYA